MVFRKDVLAAIAVCLSIVFAHAAEPKREIVDASGRSHTIGDISRIITIGGAVTEIVHALGMGERIVAVDITSTYPASVQKSPSIGYMRALAPEGVLSLSPTLVLAIEGSGPPDAVAVLARAGVPFVLVPEGYDEAGVLRKIRFVAEVLGLKQRGEQIAAAVAADFALVAEARAAIAKRQRAIFVLTIGNGTPTVAGEMTSADGIFRLAGIENAIGGINGFKPAAPEAMVAAQPDVIVTLHERGHALTPEAMFALPAFKGTPAAKAGRLIAVPSYYLSFGPRAAHAARNLLAAFYPDAGLPPLPARPWTPSPATGKQ
jgi:iron complex transport system substrate-binding protein